VPSRKRRETRSEAGLHKPDAARTRQDILRAARQEFSEHGLSGARVDAIAARMRTTKRMLYYYFGSKEGLYLAVLEQVYGDIRSVEQELDLASLHPADAIRRMIEFTFDYEEAHPEFIRLVSIENIHHGKHLAQSSTLRKQNMVVIDTLAALLERGRRVGVFRSDIDAVDLHLMISAFCFFRVANRHTFGTLFGCDLTAPLVRAKHKQMIGDAIMRMLEAGGDAGRRPDARTAKSRRPRRVLAAGNNASDHR
jgi:AcrR family transcriptional regulator